MIGGMAPTGRIPKLTPTVHKSVVKSVGAGVPLKHAAQAAGVGESTMRAWRSRGRAEGAGPYASFQADLKKAEAAAVVRNSATVQRAAAERDEVTVKETVFADGRTETVTTTRRVFEWTAAAWWLERRYPEEFSGNKKELAQLRKLVREMAADRGTDGTRTQSLGADARPSVEQDDGGDDGPPAGQAPG